MITKNTPDHIHRAGDGRNNRKVYLNGVEIKHALFADTRRGIIECAVLPLKLDKYKKRILTKRLRGTVKVEQL